MIKGLAIDDGKDLESYNIQVHWVTHSDGLYLVYTRKDADNENVIRRRAPNTARMAAYTLHGYMDKTQQGIGPDIDY